MQLATTGKDSVLTKLRRVFAHERNKKSCTIGFCGVKKRSDVCLLSMEGSCCCFVHYTVSNLVRVTSIVEATQLGFCAALLGVKNVLHRIAAK